MQQNPYMQLIGQATATLFHFSQQYIFRIKSGNLVAADIRGQPLWPHRGVSGRMRRGEMVVAPDNARQAGSR